MVNTTKRIQNNPERSLTVRQVKANLKTSCIVRHTMRRSVTIEPQLHDFIIELRGWFAMEKKLDLDYTTVLNILAKVGADIFGDISKLTEKQRELVMESINATPEEQLESASDEWWTKQLKVKLPEYDPEPIEEESQDEDKVENFDKSSLKLTTP